MEEKWLRIMPDYSSSGLWAKDGCMVDTNEVPLSLQTLNSLSHWCAMWEMNDDYLDENERRSPKFPSDWFSMWGLLNQKRAARLDNYIF
jgi:hypothetical protein